MDLDVGASLFKVDAVESGCHAKIFKGRVGFTRELEFEADGGINGISNGGRRAGNGEIINLATKENRLRAKLVRNIDIAFVGGGLEVKFRGGEDGVDVFLPESSTLRMALKSTSDRDHKRAIEGDTKSCLVPVGKDIIDREESRNLGARRMGIGIASIAGKNQVVEGSSECTEKTKDGSLNAGGVGFREFMEDGGGTRRTITAMSRATFATGFNFVLPVGAENNGIARSGAGRPKHTKVLKLVTLLVFSFVPERPGRKGFELATSEVTKGEFFRGGRMRRDGMNEVIDVRVTDSGRVRGGGIAEGMHGTEFNGGDTKIFVRVIIGGKRGGGSKFFKFLLAGRRRGKGFGGQSEVKVGGSRGLDAEMGKDGFGFLRSEYGDVVDSGQEGPNILAVGGTETAAQSGSTGERLDGSDVGPMGSSIGTKTEAKKWIIAGDAYSFIMLGGKRGSGEGETRGIIRGRIEGSRLGGNGKILMSTLKVCNIGGKFIKGQVIHALIKAGMEGNLDPISVGIKPQDVLLGMREIAEEDTKTRMVLEAAGTLAWGADPNTGAKSAEVAELRFVARVETFESRRAIAFGGKAVFDADVVVKGEGPKTGTKSRTSEHGTEGIANGLVSPFNGSVLMGRVGASGVDGVIKFFKKRDDEGVAIEFPSLVEDSIFVVNVRRVFGKPGAKPVERGTFGDTGGAGEERSGMISDENVTGFTIVTGVGPLALEILGLLSSESKINAEALVGDSGLTRGIVTSGLFSEFGSEADGALIKDGVMVLELRNTINVMVGVVQVFIAGVAETLVPEESFGTGSEAMGNESRVQRGQEGKVVPKGMDGAIMGGGVRRERRRGGNVEGEEEWFGVAEAAVQNTVDLDIIGSAEGAVGGENKSARGGTLV
jgi:hypothetical protein